MTQFHTRHGLPCLPIFPRPIFSRLLGVVTIGCAVLLSACSGLSTDNRAASTDVALTPPPNFTRGLVSTSTPEPFYPLRARSLNLEGWVLLNFSVDPAGAVIGNSIEIIQTQPPGYFERSATNAARRLRFENTQDRVVDDIRFVFRYELEDRDQVLVEPETRVVEFRELIPMRYITPDYPPTARADGIEGYVVVHFDVTETGGIENIRVIDSEPVGVFESTAREAAARLRFEPRIVNDEPVRVDAVSYRFDWTLDP